MMCGAEEISQKPPYGGFCISEERQMAITISIQSKNDGTITYSYYEKETGSWRGRNTFRFYRGEGTVPKEVTEQGRESVRMYVQDKVMTDIAQKKKEIQKHKAALKKVTYPLSVQYKDLELTGRIHWSDKEEDFVVTLESPNQKSKYWGYGNSFGGAMAGLRMFVSCTFQFTPEALQNAKQTLIDLYIESLPTYVRENWEI